MQELSKYLNEIKKLCNSNKVSKLFAFGSVTGCRFAPESDIDLLVEIDENDPVVYSDHYFNLKFGLEELLKRRIDLLEMRAKRNKYLQKKIDETKVLIYAR